MTIKTLTTIAASLLVTASVYAQSSTVTSTTEGITNPNSSIEVSPRVTTGVRSFSSGNLNKSGRGSTIGPFLSPGFELNYKSTSFSMMIDYEMESTAAAGFGKNNAGRGAFQDNAYFQHHPYVVATLNFDPNWSFVSSSDIMATLAENDEDEGFAVTSLAEVFRKVNSNLTVGVGYRLDYTDSTAAVNGFIDDANNKTYASQIKSGNLNTVPAALLASQPTADDNPKTLAHSAVARAKVKLNDTVSTNVSVQGGIDNAYGNTNSQTYWYRVNTDTTVKASKNLDLAIRARIDLKNPEGATGSNVKGTGRIIADYKITDQITANLTNTLQIGDKVSGNKAATFLNEGYLGLKYAF